MSEQASPLIGFSGKDNIGLEGLEKIYQESMQGEDGEIEIHKKSSEDWKVTLIDTGGLNDDSDDMSKAIKRQTEMAIEESDALLFVVDAIDGLLPMDKESGGQAGSSDPFVRLCLSAAPGARGRPPPLWTGGLWAGSRSRPKRAPSERPQLGPASAANMLSKIFVEMCSAPQAQVYLTFSFSFL